MSLHCACTEDESGLRTPTAAGLWSVVIAFAHWALIRRGGRGLAVERINPLPQFFGPRIHLLFHVSPSAARIKLSVARSLLLRTLHARPSPVVFLLLVWRLPAAGQPYGICCSVNTRTMNATSSSSDSKCSAWCDTRCSTRPLKSPCSVCASACSCTTNALLAGREG